MRLDQIPAAVTGPLRERLESVESSLRGQVEETSRALGETTRSLSEEHLGLARGGPDRRRGAAGAVRRAAP